ncbi:putative YccA/Bax inhibitor family protein [Cryobacterium mesophilum]|uniref:Bax inhibitor-1/YccA family protein n=1 Tax=Terrimesophilobacter mesophilus TaxID=433647 RepID=A0A4R8VC07_9MICO|nr:Bax inhibitor-1/YccA family protein [Terrimesophilobacter mesophilus]MBB5632864.1 putative YccA/Bax inhibitor family protein [Terrimesophilobacter mesophilus]TFB79640.1 Bax inhibitor-1/YccA family protein [Terrimesophilobacter mesophilus]
MASSNPAFTNSPAFTANAAKAAQLTRPTPQDLTAEQLTELYSRPSATSADTDRMGYEDTIVKIVISFAILLGGAVVGWVMPVLFLPAMIVGFVLALVNIFKKKPSPALVLVYAAVEGVFVGGVTNFFETMFPGIAVQAVMGTLAVIGVTLALFASGKVRASKRATKVFLIAMVGYLGFSVLNLVLMWTGVNNQPFGLRSAEIFGIPLGLILGVLVILMAAYSLVLDFDNIKTGVERGAPRIYGWTAAFGIMVTVVWLYLEILRLLAILRQ